MKSLFDPTTFYWFTVDRETLSFSLEKEERQEKVRLKKLYFLLLSSLFEKHPAPVSYEELKKELKNHGIYLEDLTRLHRKISELRNFLKNLDPLLKNMIQNTRDVGYHLPLHWTVDQPKKKEKKEIFDPVKRKVFEKIEELLFHTEKIAAKAKIIKKEGVYVLERTPFSDQIFSFVKRFQDLEKKLLEESRLSIADFSYIRLQNLLASLRTYLGFARISRFPITKQIWMDWHKTEVECLLKELKKLLNQI